MCLQGRSLLLLIRMYVSCPRPSVCQLHKNFPDLANLPVLPPKKLFGNLDPRFVEKRRQDLEIYLTALVEHEGTGGRVNGGPAATAAGAGGAFPFDVAGTGDGGAAALSAGMRGGLLQESQDLRAFVPQGYLKSEPAHIALHCMMLHQRC